MIRRLLIRLHLPVRTKQTATSDRAAGDVGPIIRAAEEWARWERQAIEDFARQNPDKVFREGSNWITNASGRDLIMCPSCWNGGGGTLGRVRLKGSDELFYLCDECEELWPVEQFDWDNYTVGLMTSQAREARGLRGDDYEAC
jgi:hypothetical protein